jgi:predicted O-methyltransferase YrrM
VSGELARIEPIDGPVRDTLDRLHHAARGDFPRLLRLAPAGLWALLTGKSLMKALDPARFKDVYIPVSRTQGEFLHLMARSTRARRIVEFGSSFGISTIYLAAAVRDSGGTVVTTEIEPSKCRATEANLAAAGLDPYVQVLEGDARRTLPAIEGPIDFVFLDGWKDLYLDVLEIVRGKLTKNALVVADNVNLEDAKPYLAHVRDPSSGFVSTTLYGGRLELSCFVV